MGLVFWELVEVVRLLVPPVLRFVLRLQIYHNDSLVLLVIQHPTLFEVRSK